jgi:hypothetical protein
MNNFELRRARTKSATASVNSAAQPAELGDTTRDRTLTLWRKFRGRAARLRSPLLLAEDLRGPHNHCDNLWLRQGSHKERHTYFPAGDAW